MPYLIGIDEAGRGPLAGPVAVGAAMVAEGFDWSLVTGAKDSKRMTPKSREALYEIMVALRREGKLRFAVAFSSEQTIDELGIVPAVRSALESALREVARVRLAHAEVRVLLDGGLKAPQEYENQQTIIRGDDSEPIISLASIAAKVDRDRLMQELALEYPAYGFDVHKGYGTAKHRARILEHGLSSAHRRSFCTRILPVANGAH